MREDYERINEMTESEIAVHLRKAQKFGYVCPHCGSGSHEHGTGIKPRMWRGKLRWKCFSCGRDYSNVDLLAAEWGVEAKEAVRRMTDKDISSSRDKNVKFKSDVKEENPQRDYAEFYKNAAEKFAEEEGEIRALPVEFLAKAKAGIATAEMLKEVGEGVPYGGKYLILPYNVNHFFMRGLNNDVKRGNTGGKASEIYNPLNAFENETIFAVEGQIDALSIMYSLGCKQAVAVGSAGNFVNLPSRLAELKLPRKPKVIILADNDKTGKEFAEKGVEKLSRAGYLATYFTFSEGVEKVDANSILQKENGKEELSAKCNEILKLAEKVFEEMSNLDLHQAISEIGEATELGEYFPKEYSGDVAEMKKYMGRQTGYKNIDALQILFPGLYVLGAIPSLGKTTFMWQMLEQMSKFGELCIYCSYEMTRLEMFSKTVARETYRRNPKSGLSSAEIRRGSYNATSREVEEELEKLKSSNLFVVEMSDETIDDLLKKLRKVCIKAKKSPVICLDYLQIIPSEKESAKMAVDDTARKLKIFQRETGSTIFVVSSLNRQNYMTQISFESFKESGGIEFTADVLWGLQLHVTKEFLNMDTKGNREKIDEAKKENPRKVELKCLKNRNGSLYSCYFKYYAANDYFESVANEKELTRTNRERI